MTKSQLSTIRRLTCAVNRVTLYGLPTFTLQDLGCGRRLLAATNIHSDVDFRPFQSAEDFYCVIGPRGAILRKTGSLAHCFK